MNPIAFIFFLICAMALLTVPKKWAPIPLLLGCTYMTFGQGIDVFSISLPIYRMLLIVGVARVVIKSEPIPNGLNYIDKLMIVWAIWVIFASLFHNQDRAGPITAGGEVFNIFLPYFLIRIWCTDLREIGVVINAIALILAPIMVEMMFEKLTGKNLFSVFGGVPDNVLLREGKLRAQGPFRHPILAGTVGASSIPLFVGIIKQSRIVGIIGIIAGVGITVACASSGPLMTLLTGTFGLILWRWNHFVRLLRYSSAIIYIILMVLMTRPPYYLISKIDLSGGSTGWHRSYLIERTILYFEEWWLFGCDETRHWMPLQGFASDAYHTDITNYYIGFAVTGGLFAMLLVIWMMGCAFRWVGRIHDESLQIAPDQSFMIWCFGASLFSHAVTSVSVAYFDQSMLYFWLCVAVISSTYSVLKIKDGWKYKNTSKSDSIISDLCIDYNIHRQQNIRWRQEVRK
jgi:hypothetical protein